MARFAKGTTIRITTEVADYEGNYVAPTSIKITIFIGGTIKVSAVNMTLLTSPGRYYYLWQSLITDAPGKYEVKITAVRDSRTSIKHDERAFYLY